MSLRTIIVLCLLLIINGLRAEEKAQREKVYSFVKVHQTNDWYKTQAGLWKSYIQQNNTDEEAWISYYTACRMLKLRHDQYTAEDLDEIVDDMSKAIPNSFAYHYVAHWNGGFRNTEKQTEHLFEAHKLEPYRVELLDDLTTYYEVKRDKSQLKEIAMRWYKSNDMSSGLYYWNYNMMQSTEEDAILITSGDNDTYPALVLQYAKGIRTDVCVMNNSLLGIKEYQDRYFKEIGLPVMEKTHDNFTNWNDYQLAIIEHIKKHTTRPLYFAISALPSLYEPFKDEVYNVGMAYKWSEKKFDNIAVTKRNYEKKYFLDYLQIESFNDMSQGVVDLANTNYLVSLLTLYNHYKESEDPRSNEVKVLINRIAEKNDVLDKVEQILGQQEPKSNSLVVFDPRVLMKPMVKINDSMYVGAGEVTNAMYNLYLTDLVKQKRYDELAIAKAERVDWRSYLSSDKLGLSDEELFKHGHPTSEEFPVVNVSYDAAVLYCKWLTDVYNSLEHKKKKYSSVTFRLPTEKEWEYFAQGGHDKFVYPWGGPYVRNSKGCYLGNFKTTEKADTSCAMCGVNDYDGGYFPVNVYSYFPNSFGLYNCSGNVAEMISEKGVSKGGSWNTHPTETAIVKRELYTNPSSEVGFRVVMIVN